MAQLTADLQSQITAAAQRYGVSPSLALAVAQQESGFNTGAQSSAGAIGLFQLMPGTAAGLGVNPYDTGQNIDGGVRYLSQLLSQYSGDESKALWAYNAGPGRVAAGVMPSETQSYIPKVLSFESAWNAILGVFGVAPAATPAPASPDAAGDALSADAGYPYASAGVWNWTTGAGSADTSILLIAGGAAALFAFYLLFGGRR